MSVRKYIYNHCDFHRSQSDYSIRYYTVRKTTQFLRIYHSYFHLNSLIRDVLFSVHTSRGIMNASIADDYLWYAICYYTDYSKLTTGLLIIGLRSANNFWHPQCFPYHEKHKVKSRLL